MWLDLAIAMSCCGGGLVCGWIMHAIGGFGNHTLVKQAAASITQTQTRTKIQNEPSRERVSEVANRLRDYAVSISANVDAHQTKVQAVNNTLIEGSEKSPEQVFEAVSQLVEANQTMQSQLQQAQDRIHEQSVQIETAERRAETDALTRIPNRRAFDSHIQKRHDMGAGAAGTLAILDVDNFKKFNDIYGHRAGDEVLRVVANILHKRLHAHGLVARYGGEEFALILNGCPVEEAKDLVEAARTAIGEREIQFADKLLRVTASAGVAELMHSESIEDWLQRADDGMYKSKAAGRDCAHWMDASIPVRIGPLGVGNAPMSTRAKPKSSGSRATETNSEPELMPRSVTKTDQPAKKPDPSAFAYLPDLKTMNERFLEIRGRTQSSVSIFVMAIHCNSKASSASMRSLLQVVRATMRTVDRLGCGDDSTLLICMPSMDEATALERGQRIYRSAEAIGLSANDSGEHQVSVGVAEVAADEDFASVVSRAMRLTQESPQEGSLPVYVESHHAAA